LRHSNSGRKKFGSVWFGRQKEKKQEYLSDLITALVKLNFFLAHLGILDLSISFRVTQRGVTGKIFESPTHSSADRYSAVCFDVRDNADAGNSAKLKLKARAR